MKARFVSESINFKRGSEPRDSMGIGIEEVAKRLKWRTGWGWIKNLLEKYNGEILKIGDYYAVVFTSGNTWGAYTNTIDQKYYTADSPISKEIVIKQLKKDMEKGVGYLDESINFQRGASDDDIKRELRANGPFQPGEIVVRDLPNDPHTKKLHVYVDYEPEGFLAPHKAYFFGTIYRYNGEASLIHNTQNKTGIAGLQDNDYLRRATRDEAIEIRKALKSGRYDRYIEEAKKKTGLTPFV